MKIMKKVFTITIGFVLFINVALIAQNEHHEPTQHSTETSHGKNKISIFTGFTHVSSAFYEHETHEESTGKWIPTIGIDYTYHLNKKFLIGAIIDLEFDNYLIKLDNEDEKELERANVIVANIIGMYKLTEELGFYIGPGIETEFGKNSKNFFVLKMGLEYEIEITNGWEITPSFIYDWKHEYSAFSYGFSIGKRF